MPDEFDDVLPFIARLMGLRLERYAAPSACTGIDGEALEKLDLQERARRCSSVSPTQRPLVLLFEDLHWADQSSIKLLEALLRLARSHAVLFVAVGRPDFAETLRAHPGAGARRSTPSSSSRCRLRRLTDEQCDALIAQPACSTDRMPYATRALIIRKAEGNPFYIEEVVRSLHRRRRRSSRATAEFRVTEQIDTVEIPGTIQEVIMARVDRLDEPTRQSCRSRRSSAAASTTASSPTSSAATKSSTPRSTTLKEQPAHPANGRATSTASVRRRILHGRARVRLQARPGAGDRLRVDPAAQPRKELHRQRRARRSSRCSPIA